MNRDKCKPNTKPNKQSYLCSTLPRPQMPLKSNLPKEKKNTLYIPNKKDNKLIAKIMFYI
jgi:hypothetical protein